MDITETLVDPDDRPTSRPRRAGDDVALPVREAARQLVRASFLKDFTDDGLAHMASRCMEQYKIDSQHLHIKLRGNRIYYECGPHGRKCIHGAQHKHNGAYVEFRRSGEIFFTYFSHKCKNPLRIGFWANKLNHLLYADVWGPSTKVDGRLLDRVYKLASDACDGKTLTARQLNIPDQDWFVVFWDTIAATSLCSSKSSRCSLRGHSDLTVSCCHSAASAGSPWQTM